MASVEGTVGVGRDELDVDPGTCAEVEAGVAVLPRRDDVGEHVVQPRRRQPEVDEAGPGDLDRVDVREVHRLEGTDQVAGDVARVPTGGLGRGERDVARPVPVLAARGTLHRPVDGGGVEADAGGGRLDRGGECLADH